MSIMGKHRAQMEQVSDVKIGYSQGQCICHTNREQFSGPDCCCLLQTSDLKHFKFSDAF